MLRHYLELIRFSHTLFAMPFALLAAVMAWLHTDDQGNRLPFRWPELLGILICMIAARSAAMAFNRVVDRDYDAANPRTQSRHLPAGLLSVSSVWIMIMVSALVFVGGTLLFWPNWLPIALALPVLAWLCGYSYAKRFTALAHYWLGAALMLAPICAWLAIRGPIVLATPTDLLPALILGLVVLFWVGGFDIFYACQDHDYDRQAGLHSIPARFGVVGALRIALVSHLLMLGILAMLPWAYPQFGWLFWCGYAIVAALILYEHRLVRADDLSRVNQAFFTVNAILGIGLFVVGSIDAWW